MTMVLCDAFKCGDVAEGPSGLCESHWAEVLECIDQTNEDEAYAIAGGAPEDAWLAWQETLEREWNEREIGI